MKIFIVLSSLMVLILLGWQFAVTEPINQIETSQISAVLAASVSNQTSGDMFVDMINQARSQSGTSKVLYDPILARYAEIRAQDMINQNYYDHRAPNGNDFSSLLPNMNLYHCENLDMGVGSFENAIVSWTNSQDHNDCMVHENVSRVGYAYADAGAVMYPDGLHNTYILVAIFGE